MKGFISLFFMLISTSFLTVANEPVWEGCDMKVQKYSPHSMSGLDAIFVAANLEGLSFSFPIHNAGPSVRLYKYSRLGGAYSEEIDGFTVTDGRLKLNNVEGDMGYIIENAGNRYAFWLVDYDKHPLVLSRIYVSPDDSDCDYTRLIVDGTGEEISYYGVNARKFTLSREIELHYKSLQYDNSSSCFNEVEMTTKYEYLTRILSCKSPLIPTEFIISGDRFLKGWGKDVTIASEMIASQSVSAVATLTQQNNTHENQVATIPDDSFGGSAPCVIDFNAEVTDAAAFTEWQFSHTPDFEDVFFRESRLEFTYTFNEEGSVYVRFTCADSSGQCEYYSETFHVSIGASMLKCPNAFSPGNADGVNDEWRVSYSSIISFSCVIFNRNGKKIVSFNDPAIGWDGKYNGSLVPAGVYYYVISAKGADGRQYELSGDINILNYR